MTGLSRARDRPAEGAAAAQPIGLEPLLGRWRVFAEETDGISEIEFAESSGGATVRVLGSGEGDPRDWGEADARVFAEDVSGGPAWGFRADYEFGDERVRLYGYLNRGLLALEAGTEFADGDGRSDYFTRTFLFQP